MANFDKSTQVIKLDLTWMSIIRVIVVLLGLIVIYFIRDVITLLFAVFIIVAALNPLVSAFDKKMPRLVSVFLVYLLILAVLAIFSIIVIGPLTKQINQLATIIPDTVNQYLPSIEKWRVSHQSDFSNLIESNLKNLSDKLSTLTGNVFQTIFSIFGGVITALTVFVLSFYLLLEQKRAKNVLNNILPAEQINRFYKIIHKFSEKMGAWVRGQLILMVVIGILDFIVLSVLKVDGSLALATWGGLTELIPYIGPILGAIPAIIVAWSSQGPVVALLVALIMFVFVQWLENQIIVPTVMKKAVGLSPVITILAILIGGKLFGVLGVIVAVPVAALILVVVQEWDNIVKIYNNTN